MQYGSSYGSTVHHLTKVVKSGSPIITSQEPLLVLYSKNNFVFFFIIITISMEMLVHFYIIAYGL